MKRRWDLFHLMEPWVKIMIMIKWGYEENEERRSVFF